MVLPSKEFITEFKKTDGALSVTESIAIMNLAAQSPMGNRCVEFGVYKGKSAMSAAYVLEDSLFCLVEPEFKSKRWATQVRSLVELFANRNTNLSLSGMYSTDWLKDNEREFGWVFVDSGSHQDGLPMQEAKLLEDRMVQGGIIAWHDWNSQFKEVLEATEYLISTGKYEYVPINWGEIIEYVNANDLEANNLSWHHQEMKNPNFVGAVKRK